MNRQPLWAAYGLAAVVFLALDSLWLSTMAPRLYRPKLGHLMADELVWPAAVLFYALYLLGVVVFTVRPGLQAASTAVSLRHGALFGLIAYATYDLTNQATLRDWPWLVTAVDLVWGATVTGISAGVTTWWLLRRTRR